MSTTAVTGAIAAIFTTVAATNLVDFQADVLWLLVVGFLIAFILAFAVGANDVANSFGTTVGAKTLTLRQACILASVFESLGAILLGAKVGETIRKGIIDANIYIGHEKLLMVGEVSAMIGSGLWQLLATFLKLPVSGTHSIVGATVGFSLVAMGVEGVNWPKMGLIVASWFISPVLAGAMAGIFYYLLRKLIFLKEDPVTPGLIAMPILYGCAIAINFFSIFFSGAPMLGLDAIPLWGDFVISLLLGITTYLIVRLVVVVRMESSFNRKREEEMAKAVHMAMTPNASSPMKKTILAPVLETISEKDPLMSENGVSESGTPNGSKNLAAGDAPMQAEKEPQKIQSSPRKTSTSNHSNKTSNHSEVNGRAQKMAAHRQLVFGTTEEKRKSAKTRTQSASDDRHDHVRIPPVLLLEKGVLKARTPDPTVAQLKQAIRKNFSEPSMVNLTENIDGDFFEVHISRQRRSVTIQRKKRTASCGARSESSLRFCPNGERKSETAEEDDALLEGIPRGSQVNLEEPFDESDDEGMGLTMTTHGDQEVMRLASEQKSYTGAIQEGFRKLSTSQTHDIIEIKVAAARDEDSETGELKDGQEEEDKEDGEEVRRIFSFLQILTACFGAFAHGGNDVSNAIGPLIALYIIYAEGSVEQLTDTPLWILLYGGLGICVGLWVWGRRVIKTMGEDLTSLTPSRGFAIELMSSVTVLAASNVGIPVSTTHCKVGAVVSVGWVRAREAVDWKIFRNIVLAWFVTVPVSGGLSAVVFLLMRAVAGL